MYSPAATRNPQVPQAGSQIMSVGVGRHHLDHQLDDVAGRAELAVLAGGGDLDEHVLVDVALGVAVLHRDLVEPVDGLLQSAGVGIVKRAPFMCLPWVVAVVRLNSQSQSDPRSVQDSRPVRDHLPTQHRTGQRATITDDTDDNGEYGFAGLEGPGFFELRFTKPGLQDGESHRRGHRGRHAGRARCRRWWPATALSAGS